MNSIDSFKTRAQLRVNDTLYHYFSLKKLEQSGLKTISRLPFTLKILLENLLRFEDNHAVCQDDIKAMAHWLTNKTSDREIAYRPARVLMQDFTGVPAIVDLGAMRDAIKKMGGDPVKINPLTPVDLVIDHSIQVDSFARQDALDINAHLEMKRNGERYAFLRWGQKAFDNFQVVPPETGICHQVNLEFLAKTVWQEENEDGLIAYPDTVVGTDSHTTMINGLGVLGWGVGGIEAEAAMLGQPISMLIPEVIGVKLWGKLSEGVTATDLVLTVTEMLRKKGVVGKFVEYFGPGLAELAVSDRATLANMAPEYGATCGFFPVDQATLDYLHLTGRDESTIALVEAYSKAQGLWHDYAALEEAIYTDIVTLDLNTVKPSLAGPKRPQDRLDLPDLKPRFQEMLSESTSQSKSSQHHFRVNDDCNLLHGDVVIAAITSCTNTSNPNVLLAAGLIAKKALEHGLQRKPWVKSSLAPGSQVVTRYLEATGLQTYLDQLGFEVVGYGCTTCIGNSGPLPEAIAKTIDEEDLMVCAVLSGNRNFEGRIHPQVKANWLASPPLVVIFALTGTVNIDLTQDAIGKDKQGKPIYLKDLWPSNAEIAAQVTKVKREMFREQYANVFVGKKEWQAINIPAGKTYQWVPDSTYIQHPPFFTDMSEKPEAISDIKNAHILAIFGDSITTDHISPAGAIKLESPAGQYLQEKGVAMKDFNSYGARRGNHEIMMRGTFANIRLKNEIVPETEGGFTQHFPSFETMPIYDAAMRYQQKQIPLIIIAGKEYGTGSSRDWAAKGPKLLGIRAVIAESFERIHRSNLIGMGILPLEFKNNMTRQSLNLDGSESVHILGINNNLKPGALIKVIIERNTNKKSDNGDPNKQNVQSKADVKKTSLIKTSAKENSQTEISQEEITLLCRIDTHNEMEYYKHGGILQYVLRKMQD